VPAALTHRLSGEGHYEVRVTGIVRLPASDAPYRVDGVRVSVRDVTEHDGPALTVAEYELPGLEVPAAGADLPFELDATLDPRRDYAVRAHATRGGSQEVEVGDFVSTSRHRVAPDQRLVVPLDPVGG
jgi:hypothetical protein